MQEKTVTEKATRFRPKNGTVAFSTYKSICSTRREPQSSFSDLSRPRKRSSKSTPFFCEKTHAQGSISHAKQCSFLGVHAQRPPVSRERIRDPDPSPPQRCYAQPAMPAQRCQQASRRSIAPTGHRPQSNGRACMVPPRQACLHQCCVAAIAKQAPCQCIC